MKYVFNPTRKYHLEPLDTVDEDGMVVLYGTEQRMTMDEYKEFSRSSDLIVIDETRLEEEKEKYYNSVIGPFKEISKEQFEDLFEERPLRLYMAKDLRYFFVGEPVNKGLHDLCFGYKNIFRMATRRIDVTHDVIHAEIIKEIRTILKKPAL